MSFTPKQIKTIQGRVVSEGRNPAYVLIDVGQSIREFLDILKQEFPQVQSWTDVAPSHTRLSSLPGLGYGEMGRLLGAVDDAREREFEPVETGGAFLNSAFFLGKSHGVFLAAIEQAMKSAKVIVIFVGASHIPEDFFQAVKASSTASGEIRIFFVAEAGYLASADHRVSSLFESEECYNLIESDTIDYYHQRAISILGGVPVAYDMACLNVELQRIPSEKPDIAFIVDELRQLPNFERAVQWLKKHPESSVMDCVRNYYIPRASIYFKMRPDRSLQSRFEQTMVDLARKHSTVG